MPGVPRHKLRDPHEISGIRLDPAEIERITEAARWDAPPRPPAHRSPGRVTTSAMRAKSVASGPIQLRLRGSPRLRGGTGAAGQAAASRSSKRRFTSTPHAKPPIVPSPRRTRWQGTKSAGALRAQMDAAARTAAGEPKAVANPV